MADGTVEGQVSFVKVVGKRVWQLQIKLWVFPLAAPEADCTHPAACGGGRRPKLIQAYDMGMVCAVEFIVQSCAIRNR
jgi:hypothetical protein